GKVAEFDTMLQANPQLATTNELPLEQPLLHWVAANGNLAMARRLLELGADPNMEAPMLSYQDAGGFEADVYGEKGASPLHIAVAHGHHELAGLLIQQGAKFEPQTEQGLSILQAACAAGNEKVV